MTRTPGAAPKGNLDYFGIFASSACAVHCVFTGVALGSASFLNFLENPVLEALLTISALGFALSAIGISYLRVHRKALVPALAAAGAALLLASRVWPELGREAEAVWSIAAAVLLVSAHVLNLKLTHRRMHELGDAEHSH